IPTAQTLFGETTVTLRSWLLALAAVLMFGLGTSVQVLPFQWSVNVTSAPVEAVVDPTAQASVGVIARTESRLLPRAGCGEATTLQLAPFQCSTKLWLGSVPPTAQTSLGPVALTDVR